MGWVVELRAFLDAWFRPELQIRRSATVHQPSKDGCASSRRPRPFSSLKTAIRRSDTIHKSPRGDAPGQPKSLRNRRFFRQYDVLAWKKRFRDKGVRSRQKELAKALLDLRWWFFTRLRAEGKRKSGRTGTEFQGESWLFASE